MRQADIYDIITELKGLHFRQTELIHRLESLRGRSNSSGPNLIETPGFSIGDRVTIMNPGLLQANRGTVFKIGAKQVTVLAPNGSKIHRAPKNLRRDNN